MSEALHPTLIIEVKQLIQTAKQRAIIAVNAELTMLYWQVGTRITVDILPSLKEVDSYCIQLDS